jgi:hypothetical protein
MTRTPWLQSGRCPDNAEGAPRVPLRDTALPPRRERISAGACIARATPLHRLCRIDEAVAVVGDRSSCPDGMVQPLDGGPCPA